MAGRTKIGSMGAPLLAGVALAAGLGSAAPAGAQALATVPNALIAGATSGDDLAGFLLPYTPYLFDALVYAGRNVAVITYGSRRYDPLTRTFVVTELEARRGPLQVSVGQIRFGKGTTLLNNVSVDTRALPLDPPVRDALKRLNSETVTGSLAITVGADEPSASYDMSLTADVDKMGRLTLDGSVEGFHVLVPLDDLEGSGLSGSEAPTVAGRLTGARIAFDDAGLVPVLYEVIGEAQGLSAAEVRGLAVAGASQALSGALSSLPGDPATLRAATADWPATLQRFFEKPGHIELNLTPDKPLELAAFGNEAAAADTLAALKPSLSLETRPAAPFIDPATIGTAAGLVADDRLGYARQLIGGVGVPQDVGRGLGLVAEAAAAGDEGAARLVAAALALQPDAELGQTAAAGAYATLLVADASGNRVSEPVLATLRTRLDADGIIAAEGDAFRRFGATDKGQRQREIDSAAIASRNWPRVRDLAFAYLEGSGVPRHVVRAYVLATTAAAGGDRVAATLRDDMVRAARDGSLALPLDRARAGADRLWGQIVAGSGGTAPVEGGTAGAQ